MGWFEQEFEAPVQIHDVGRYRYTVVYLPIEIERALPRTRPPVFGSRRKSTTTPSTPHGNRQGTVGAI